jgi:hypothetical protein
MTEQQWLTCTDPTPMLEFLRDLNCPNERQLRLFAIACCRRVWHRLRDQDCERAVEVLERWVDGQATVEEVTEAHRLARKEWGLPARTAVSEACVVELNVACAIQAASHAAWAAAGRSRAEECKAQAALLRCVTGNPLRPPSPLDRDVLAWTDGIIVQMATTIHDDRLLPSGELDPARLAVLCDALLDASCPAEHELLAHLRGAGPHVRGCITVGAILGRKQ